MLGKATYDIILKKSSGNLSRTRSPLDKAGWREEQIAYNNWIKTNNYPMAKGILDTIFIAIQI